MIRDQAVRPLTDLTDNPGDFLAKLQQTPEPILLTMAGQGELIVQDPKSYQKMLDQIERLETIQAVRRGLAEAARGENRPMEEFFDELEAELQESGDA